MVMPSGMPCEKYNTAKVMYLSGALSASALRGGFTAGDMDMRVSWGFRCWEVQRVMHQVKDYNLMKVNHQI